jgi:hypothetical protein
MLNKNFIFMLFLFLVSIELNAQSTQDNSTGILWTNVHLTKKLPKNFSAKVKLSYYDTNPLLSARFIDVGGLYQTKNKISIGLYYRFNGTFEMNPRRVYIEATHKGLKSKKLGIQIMPRFRIQYKGKINDCGKLESSLQFRPRITIRKQLKHAPSMILYTSVETFHETQPTTFINFRRVRFDLGIRYRLPKQAFQNDLIKQEMQLFFRHQSDFDEPEIVALNILNVGYFFTF